MFIYNTKIVNIYCVFMWYYLFSEYENKLNITEAIMYEAIFNFFKTIIDMFSALRQYINI